MTPKLRVFLLQMPFVQRFLDRQPQLVQFIRLDDIIVGTRFHRLHSDALRAVRGYQNKERRARLFVHFLQQRNAVHFRHADVA